jgi:hypothetical protein
MIVTQWPAASAHTALGKANGGAGPTIGTAIESAKSRHLMSQHRLLLVRLHSQMIGVAMLRAMYMLARMMRVAFSMMAAITMATTMATMTGTIMGIVLARMRQKGWEEQPNAVRARLKAIETIISLIHV